MRTLVQVNQYNNGNSSCKIVRQRSDFASSKMFTMIIDMAHQLFEGDSIKICSETLNLFALKNKIKRLFVMLAMPKIFLPKKNILFKYTINCNVDFVGNFLCKYILL